MYKYDTNRKYRRRHTLKSKLNNLTTAISYPDYMLYEYQMSDNDKIPLADFVIQNDGSESVLKQVYTIYQELVIA